MRFGVPAHSAAFTTVNFLELLLKWTVFSHPCGIIPNVRICRNSWTLIQYTIFIVGADIKCCSQNSRSRPLLCATCQAWNARTCPDQYPVPHMQDFAQALDGATVFSTLDLVRAFNQIPVAQENIPKTAITTPFGLFEFPFMTFGPGTPHRHSRQRDYLRPLVPEITTAIHSIHLRSFPCFHRHHSVPGLTYFIYNYVQVSLTQSATLCTLRMFYTLCTMLWQVSNFRHTIYVLRG